MGKGHLFPHRGMAVSALSFAAAALWSCTSQAASAPVPPEIPVALLVDLSTGQQLYAREADRRFVPASVVKVMTAYTAFRLISEGKLSLDRQVEITEELAREWSGKGSSMFLKAGERPRVAELLLGITTVSGNDASMALAISAAGSLESWLALMNGNAAALGMRNTHFGSPNGFPDEGRTFTSAHDLALLGKAIVTRHPALYRQFFGHRTFTWGNRTQENHDPVTGVVPGADGMKTGFTSEAGFTFLGSAERNGRRLVMVLAGAPTAQVRDTSARAMLEWGFANFAVRRLATARTRVGEAMVQDGTASKVGLVAAKDIRLAFPRDGSAKVRYTIRYLGPIRAPVREGQQVAALIVALDGEEVLEVPLLAEEGVSQAGFFRRIINGFAGWLD